MSLFYSKSIRGVHDTKLVDYAMLFDNVNEFKLINIVE